MISICTPFTKRVKSIWYQISIYKNKALFLRLKKERSKAKMYVLRTQNENKNEKSHLHENIAFKYIKGIPFFNLIHFSFDFYESIEWLGFQTQQEVNTIRFFFWNLCCCILVSSTRELHQSIEMYANFLCMNSEYV